MPLKHKGAVTASRKRIPVDLLSNARRRAKEKGLAFTITAQDIVVPEMCPVLGLKLAVNYGNEGRRAADCSPSIDRIDPSKGYVPGNIVVISYRANCIKSFGTAEEHQRVADWMKSLS